MSTAQNARPDPWSLDTELRRLTGWGRTSPALSHVLTPRSVEEIAARTVNKTRAQEGEAEEASRTSVQDESPSQRGGRRSHSGAQGRTKEQLYEDAKRQDVEGRSSMTKEELREAVEDR